MCSCTGLFLQAGRPPFVQEQASYTLARFVPKLIPEFIAQVQKSHSSVSLTSHSICTDFESPPLSALFFVVLCFVSLRVLGDSS